ncbi:MAG: hypothetical protein KAR20_24585, partial [Candidatus Heimdallarchaeota archaeon]|nr:hypothetical protein [Candidatus Heimdallarchaeota archaeon]
WSNYPHLSRKESMSPKQIINGIELRFWQLAIPAFKKSIVFKKTFLLGYQGIQKYKIISFGYQVIICLCVSLLIGLSIGLISNII